MALGGLDGAGDQGYDNLDGDNELHPWPPRPSLFNAQQREGYRYLDQSRGPYPGRHVDKIDMVQFDHIVRRDVEDVTA